MTLNVRIDEEDTQLLEKEEGAWARAAVKAYAEYLADPETYSHEEMGRLLGISDDD